MSERYAVIDEEGYWMFDGKRVDDESLGRSMLENLELDSEERLTTSMENQKAFVEYFDAPLIALHVRALDDSSAEIDLPYGLKTRFAYDSLSLDEWDRFHGLALKNIPFVFSRQAQIEFFDLLDSFDDESITVGSKHYEIPAWLAPHREGEAPQFWTELYNTQQAGWDQKRESVILPAIVPQLKLSKSRILVVGCGEGHDAAYFASLGHLVTAVDFSEEAIRRAKEHYGSREGLNFFRADAFNLPENWSGQFDIVFEHTCYCAVSPDKRSQLVQIWRKMLQPQGHLLAIFFAHEKRRGPPFGGSEWELRQRLKSGFSFLYWTRWRNSVERRKGKELVVYARKKDLKS